MIKHKNLKDKELENISQKRVLKPYVKPHLVEYGRMEKLTESGGSGAKDIGVSRFRQ